MTSFPLFCNIQIQEMIHENNQVSADGISGEKIAEFEAEYDSAMPGFGNCADFFGNVIQCPGHIIALAPGKCPDRPPCFPVYVPKKAAPRDKMRSVREEQGDIPGFCLSHQRFKGGFKIGILLPGICLCREGTAFQPFNAVFLYPRAKRFSK